MTAKQVCKLMVKQFGENLDLLLDKYAELCRDDTIDCDSDIWNDFLNDYQDAQLKVEKKIKEFRIQVDLNDGPDDMVIK